MFSLPYGISLKVHILIDSYNNFHSAYGKGVSLVNMFMNLMRTENRFDYNKCINNPKHKL